MDFSHLEMISYQGQLESATLADKANDLKTSYDEL
jgi:hypothetical protein